MSLFVEQNGHRSKLQEKLAAELQEKARRTSKTEGGADGGGQKLPDGVDDSAYMESTKKTSSLAGAWIVLALIAVGIIIWLAIVAMKR